MNMAAIIDDVRTRLEANGPECRMDQVVDLCPDLTWNQVFLAVDYLSRTSQVRLVMDRACRYWVKIIPPTHCTSDAASTAALT
jgi:hypothetical protein